MGNRAIENRIKKLQEIETQQKALEQEAEKLKEEIKRRWKPVTSSRLEGKH